MVLADLRRIVGDESYRPRDARDLCSRLFTTAYLSSETSSSGETRRRARALAEQIGSHHLELPIDAAFQAIVNAFRDMPGGGQPRFRAHGGTDARENLALQNVQARLRMVHAYFLGQLVPWARGQSRGQLLILAASNVDEALRGYMTKYDCMSADVNPIGGIAKNDLKKFLRYCVTRYKYTALLE